jgi:hypothetical protein
MRFTIRDMLWLTLVIALCVSWFRDRASERAWRIETAKIHAQEILILSTEINGLKESKANLEFRVKHGVDPPP